jgi:hypothetical protein
MTQLKIKALPPNVYHHKNCAFIKKMFKARPKNASSAVSKKSNLKTCTPAHN